MEGGGVDRKGAEVAKEREGMGEEEGKGRRCRLKPALRGKGCQMVLGGGAGGRFGKGGDGRRPTLQRGGGQFSSMRKKALGSAGRKGMAAVVVGPEEAGMAVKVSMGVQVSRSGEETTR